MGYGAAQNAIGATGGRSMKARRLWSAALGLWCAASALGLAACDPGHGATDAPDVPVVDSSLPDDGTAAGADASADADVWPAGDWLPTTVDQLYGLWVNDDGTTLRVFEIAEFDSFDPDMAQVTPVYQLYRYPKGTTSTLAERGRLSIAAGPVLQLATVWSQTATDQGKVAVLTLVPAAAGSFALATTTGAPRVYTKTGKLP